MQVLKILVVPQLVLSVIILPMSKSKTYFKELMMRIMVDLI